MDTSPLFERIAAAGRIDADDVLALRREVFEDGGVSREEARAVFELNRACAEKDESWLDFFVDELTYYFIYQAPPRGYMSEENARFLIDEVTRDGRKLGAAELQLVVNVIDRAHHCPETLVAFALEALKDGVLDPASCSFGRGRAPGVVTEADTELIRSIIHGSGGGGSYTLTRREADLLFELSRSSDAATNALAWRELFAAGVGSYLLFPAVDVPEVDSAEEIMERRAWFASQAKSGSFLKALGRALASPDFDEAARSLDFFGRHSKEQEATRAARDAQRHAVVNEEEAAWLLAKLDPAAGRTLSEDEKALLAFVRSRADAVHVSLEPLMEKAGLGAPKPSPCHRSHHAA
ncbi:MAG: hypothetical protein ACE5EF_04070 [Dehalococcoidia bacterium]